MSKVYLYADPHFGHENMAKKRGFKTVEEHDEFIVKKWNETVNKNDKIYLLGDITMEKSNYEILKRLKGNKVVVLGNHDKPGHIPELLKYVSAVAGAIKYKGYLLTHVPIHKKEIKRFRANIHGHVHENIINNSKYVCVSAEAVNYIPLEISTININFNLKKYVYNIYSKLITFAVSFRMGRRKINLQS